MFPARPSKECPAMVLFLTSSVTLKQQPGLSGAGEHLAELSSLHFLLSSSFKKTFEEEKHSSAFPPFAPTSPVPLLDHPCAPCTPWGVISSVSNEKGLQSISPPVSGVSAAPQPCSWLCPAPRRAERGTDLARKDRQKHRSFSSAP